MDILDRLLGHDAWTTRQFLLLCRPLADVDLDREFPIGPGSLRRTFDHLIDNMEFWTDTLRCVPARAAAPVPLSIDEHVVRLDAIAPELAATAAGLRDAGKLDAFIPTAAGEPQRTFGGVITHVLTHSQHHRAQILNMLRHLGHANLPEGDALSWEAAHRVVGQAG